MLPDVVRDKDGISAALLVADLAAALAAEGRTLLDRLDELAAEFGRHSTAQISVRVDDLSQIADTMAALRADPPRTLLGRPATAEDLLPDADVLRWRAEDVRVVVRPSGTEPKLKAYLEVVGAGPAGAWTRLPAARETAAAALTLGGLAPLPRKHSTPPAGRLSDAQTRAELAVAGVAEPRHDVGLVVEPLVDRGGDQPQRQPALLQRALPLRRDQHADHGDVVAPRSVSSRQQCSSEPPVATIGSSTSTGRPASEDGSDSR